MMRMRLAAGLLVALVAFVPAVSAGDTPRPYPPSGSPDPGPPCGTAAPAGWVGFVCNFVTLDRWLQAGRPDFIDSHGKRWQPWFYGKRGLTNQMLIEGEDYRPEREGWLEALFDVGAFEAETYDYFWDLFRYTPWSVQFSVASRCGGGLLANPSALVDVGIRREHLLGMGWAPFGGDPADPTNDFPLQAFPVLFALAGPGGMPGPAHRDSVDALAEGRGRLWPDYRRNAEVWFLAPEVFPPGTQRCVGVGKGDDQRRE